MMDELKKCKVLLSGDASFDGISPTTLFIEKTPNLSSKAMEADARYQRLAEVGRQQAVVNRPYGQDKTRGTHIRKLYRIGTDSKIFAEPLNMKMAKPMQVMIVVDCSSSMSGVIGRACEAALGAANGLAEARCEVAVFGHTAESLGGSEVTIHRFKDFNEPISVLPYRLRGSFSMSQNRDGFAIWYLAKKLRDSRRRRLMIVISDGAPQASSYGGSPGIQHSKQVVDEARQAGIDVMSISITESAHRANRVIYGERNDVYDRDPHVIEDNSYNWWSTDAD